MNVTLGCVRSAEDYSLNRANDHTMARRTVRIFCHFNSSNNSSKNIFPLPAQYLGSEYLSRNRSKRNPSWRNPFAVSASWR